MDDRYRAIYGVRNRHRGTRRHDGSLTTDLDQLKQQAAGIVNHWPSVTSAVIYGYPSGIEIVAYHKQLS